jgi:Rps23 Pro-64 3,4-dihydroxylase Tpa1-like proline 4-hydroxylase
MLAPLQERIQRVLPQALHKLGLPSLRIAGMEAQITATNDGQSLRFPGAPKGAELTFILMMHDEPKAFSGGDLRIYHARLRRGRWTAADSFKTVDVDQNRLVMFPSRFAHEIGVVHCPSRAFRDSLFTVTGWLKK